MKPSSESLSIRGYARHRGVSHTAVAKAVKAGRIATDANGKIDPVRADRDWADNTDQSKPSNTVTSAPAARRPGSRPTAATAANGSAEAPTGAPSGAATYSQSRGIRETYLARLAKVDYEERIGKLVDADQIRVAQFNAARKTRDMLIGVPSRIAPLVVGMTEAAEVERILDVEIHRVCSEIAAAVKS